MGANHCRAKRGKTNSPKHNTQSPNNARNFQPTNKEVVCEIWNVLCFVWYFVYVCVLCFGSLRFARLVQSCYIKSIRQRRTGLVTKLLVISSLPQQKRRVLLVHELTYTKLRLRRLKRPNTNTNRLRRDRIQFSSINRSEKKNPLFPSG